MTGTENAFNSLETNSNQIKSVYICINIRRYVAMLYFYNVSYFRNSLKYFVTYLRSVLMCFVGL